MGFYEFSFEDVCLYIDTILYNSYFVSKGFYNLVKNEDWFDDSNNLHWYDNPVIPYMMSLDDVPKNEDLHTFVFSLFLSQPPEMHKQDSIIPVAWEHYLDTIEGQDESQLY